MEIRSYNAELALANIMFKAIFSNIKIEKTINSKTTQILVNCVLGNRSRILKNIQNETKNGMYHLPLIVINRTGYSRQPNRHSNPNNEVKYEMTSKYRNTNILTPVPIDINYEVSVISKNPYDIDQIASNFMVFFNPDKYVSCEHPKYEGVMMNNQVIMDDSISEEHLDELSPDQDDFITTTFNFIFKTYLFGGLAKSKKVPGKILSTYTECILSNIIQDLSPEEIQQYLDQHPTEHLSVINQQPIMVEVSKYVDNPDLSAEVYDEFIPLINTIYGNFYATPYQISDYYKFTDYVDNSEMPQLYRDRLIWNFNSYIWD